MLWWTVAAWAALPEVTVRWKGAVAHLEVHPPEGASIAPEAPVHAALTVGERPLDLQVDGAYLVDGIALGDARGQDLSGRLDLQLCAKTTGICSPVAVELGGSVPERRRGELRLDVAAPRGEAHHGPSPFNRDARPGAEEAFEAARREGSLVLLDFSAIWCPPCNLLASEVLHAADAPELLEGFELAVVDVDHPSSWALKDRYRVGSYPTVVVTDGEGKERGRLVGYPGREAFLRFLEGLRDGGEDWSAVDPSTLEPDRAAEGLLWWVERGETDLEPWLEASKGSDSYAARYARFRLRPNADAFRWMVEHHPDRALPWLEHGHAWLESEEGRAALREAGPRLLVHLPPEQGADLLWYLASLDDEPALYAAAASILRARLTGDFDRDRGYLDFIATLFDRAGEPAAAVALLDRAAMESPDEPTFLLAAAYHLNEHGRHAEALERAQRALDTAWGDNRLRVAEQACVALAGMGRDDEAADLAARILAEVPAPEPGLEVRTHRYREKLEAFLR